MQKAKESLQKFIWVLFSVVSVRGMFWKYDP